jgi:IS5 family transposase
LNGEEEVVYADDACRGFKKRGEISEKSIEFRVAMRTGKYRILPDTDVGRLQNFLETAKEDICIKIEHPFRVN